MSTVTQDLLYAWRVLRRSPGFAAVAMLTLGLGVGATTTIFSVVNGVLVRPLPYRYADRVANLWVDFGVGAQSLPAMSPGDFRDYQQRSRTFDMMAAGSGAQVVGATGALTGDGGEPERVDVSPVSANFFALLGVDPIYGRHFLPDEEAPGGPRVVMLSHGLWKRRYLADPNIVGRSIRLDGLDQLVVGVLPEGFRLWLPSEAFLITDSQIWKPLQFNYRNQPPRNFTFFTVFGRLKPGATFGEAQAEMSEIARQLRQEHAVHEAAGMQIRVVPLQHDVVKHARPALVALFGAVGLLLLIACANVAHLLLARATAREREIAVRGALGATRLRLLRQLVTESLALAAGGGVVGVMLASLATAALIRLAPPNLPRLDAVHIDGMAVAFAVAMSALTAVVFGLAPALRAAGLDVNRTLRATGSASSSQVRLRRALMIAEMALALVLLIGAGLMIRSFSALQRVRPGFDPDRLLTMRLALPAARYGLPGARAVFARTLEQQLRAIPGVTEIGIVSQLPLSGSGSLSPYAYNEATARNWESETSDGRSVSPAYFKAMGTRLVAGRFFDEHDAGGPPIVIVDETMAARAWPGENPIGKQLQVQPNGSEHPFAEVVGVVEHIRMHDVSRAVRPHLYTPAGALGRFGVVIRASVDPASLTSAVREVMTKLDRELPLDRLRPMADYLADARAQARLNLMLMTLFGGVALLLAAIGIYGVFSYSVGQRTREIGIRLALGEEPSRVRNAVMLEALRVTAVGAAIGLAAAYVLSRSVSALLYQVRPGDPLTFVTMAGVLTLVALAGCYLPARRATAVNPLLALKAE